ncbi:HAD family hydrolase [Dietzia cinnamea]|uniref:HAD family hydrolase n=1 Tax=Dietzia cinnamea TaxID=321318 RepID=A0A4R3ZTY0_9ACTN|nr:HAD family hydrolase [Dietzia cinnamea]MBM7230665.1 HAD family phosphatase [Dietzia cinnamea]MCT1713448.1 Cof-type HAD-IIB family hydrolase [Dietzia cinnamea]MCT1886947.1 Cof-type HAD-IIB family hydrolase [Dietzia cinnamea]MCT2098388.1 Cof-type HAD-IIB family hydrolase [Dietzia cinnamea]MCT2121847.1 Cof-type HAD-IIB family hydrolase [Dietzia cinnamea]
MSRSRPLLVATDVDGTLIGSDDLVPAANLAVVEDLVADGATFVLATGRPPRWLAQVVDQLPVAPLAVCANGAVIMDTGSGEFLETSLLDPDTLAAIDEVLRERLPGSGIAAERLGADAADADFVASPDYEHAWIHPAHLEVGHAEVLSEPVLKLLARVPGMPSADMLAALRGEVDHLADVTYSTTNGLIEFAARGVTKASGLARIAASTAAATATPSAEVPVTVAFGDMPNDLEMLRWADHGVAMGNAIPAVHAAADEVTLTNDEAGFAHVLRRWWN